MTYDEAVRALEAQHSEWCHDCGGRSIEVALDIIGFRQMQENCERQRESATTQALGRDRALYERDAARALADQLAKALQVAPVIVGANVRGSALAAEQIKSLLAAYDARDWK